MSEQDQALRQIDRLIASDVLHGSESLCKLLRYLAHHALEHPGVPLKEYQIATEEFSRPADFDPAVDSLGRVQAGRLRVKLAEFYAAKGAADPVRIELPKGTYSLAFHLRQPGDSRPHASEPHATEPFHSAPPQTSHKWLMAVITLSVLLAAALAALYFTRHGVGLARVSEE